MEKARQHSIVRPKPLTDPVFHMISGGPRPVAPFSHAVENDGWVILTGQMPTDPKAPDAPLPEGIEAQTRRGMDNLCIGSGVLRLTRRLLGCFECTPLAFVRLMQNVVDTYCIL